VQKKRVSAISFYNTLPFIYGLKNNAIMDDIELSLDPPAICADRLLAGTVDIGLVPIASISEIRNANIFSNYCISANGPARTVILASQVPVEEIKEIVLDYQSRTSVQLIQVLVREFWKYNISFRMGSPGFEETEIKDNTGAIVIGDKAFIVEKKYKYSYDLAAVWKNFTGLPFVFACWVANCNLKNSFIDKFEEAIHYGVLHIHDASLTAKFNGLNSVLDIEHYLKNNMNYILDENKKEAMKLFLKMIAKSK
jgi:chorismate dehydratase